MSYFSHIYDGERENTRLNVKSEYGRMAFTKSFWYSHSNQPFTIYLAASHKAMKIISVCLAYFCFFFYFVTLVFLRHRNFISSLSIFFAVSRSFPISHVLCCVPLMIFSFARILSGFILMFEYFHFFLVRTAWVIQRNSFSHTLFFSQKYFHVQCFALRIFSSNKTNRP